MACLQSQAAHKLSHSVTGNIALTPAPVQSILHNAIINGCGSRFRALIIAETFSACNGLRKLGAGRNKNHKTFGVISYVHHFRITT